MIEWVNEFWYSKLILIFKKFIEELDCGHESV